MFTLSPIRRLWWAVAVVAIACQTPTRAEAAGCSGHSGGLYSVIETEPPSDAAPVAPTGPKPCQGPNCSNAPLRDGLPPAPVTTPPTPVKDQVRCLALAGNDSPPAFDRDRSAPRPIRFSTPIFHPPRAG